MIASKPEDILLHVATARWNALLSSEDEVSSTFCSRDLWVSSDEAATVAIVVNADGG